jgi:ankyrin repeat protein/serine/threonine protein kinase
MSRSSSGSGTSSPRQQQSHLCRLLEGAADSNSKTKWNLVLNYLQSHTLSNSEAPTPPFDSPLPPNSCPTVELEDQLLDSLRKNPEDTPLKIAVKSAPSYIVAALCHLGPEATGMTDSRDRLPLHWACMRSSDGPETNRILQILIECNPDGLTHRDDNGRTPLHWLLWHHASSRQVSIVKFMCQNHPVEDIRSLKQPAAGSDLPRIPSPSKSREIPPSAAIIPDAHHGALPLHYAVMKGASREVLKALIAIYPGALACKDGQGRTPLAWYLGAGSLIENSRNVCGESSHPNDYPWWKEKLSTSVVQMLLSSKVARTIDSTGRTPLHWASHFYAQSAAAGSKSSFLSIKVFQMLLDNNIGALTVPDGEGQTPLHVLFDVVFREQENEYHRQEANRKNNDAIDLKKGGPVAFAPPMELIHLLVRSPDVDDGETLQSACHVEDNAGCLPIHVALRATTSPEIIKLLICTNPTSLIHGSEDKVQTPLVQAFSSPFSAPLQPLQILELMMAAYTTSRHGTYMDGRLALKMEDAIGNYPIHYAVRNNASLEAIRMFVEKFPRVALFQNAEGDMPIHCMLSKENLFEPPKNGMIRGASLAKPIGLLTDKEIAWQKQVKHIQVEKMRILLEPLLEPQHLKVASLAHGLTPLHIAIGFGVLDYNKLHRMLDVYPEAASLQTKAKGHEMYCLDLHDARRNEVRDEDGWHSVRELVFSFNPLLKNHRHKEDLLASCVKLVRDEIAGVGSYHSEQMKLRKSNGTVDVDISDILTTIGAPDVDYLHHTTGKASKRKGSKEQTAIGGFLNNLSISGSLSYGKSEKKEKVVTSIYDDDLDTGYVVSPQSSVCEDDDSFLSPRAGPAFEYHSLNRKKKRELLQAVSNENIEDGARFLKKKKLKKDMPPKILSEQQSYQVEGGETPFLSEVAMRIWCFFVLFRDPKNPDDNYISQVEEILEDLEFDLVERMITMPVPDYARGYLEEGTATEGVTLHDVATPCCMAFFHSVYYFLGRYEFATETDRILMHRSSDRQTVWIKAIEHRASTAEYQSANEMDPGAVEQSIWETGEIVQEEEGYLAPKFRDSKIDVYFKLSKSQSAYENEIECRKEIDRRSNGGFVVPLVGQYSAFGDSKLDQRYQADARDDRFEVLNLSGGESIQLSDYPYAFVYPYYREGDLFDHFYHHGVEGMEEVVDVTTQVAKALQGIHENGVVVSNISMRNITRMTVSTDALTPQRIWAVSNLSSACKLQSATSFMGAISHDGSAQFQTGLMPPEMFVKLTAAEARIYRNYWEMVEKLYNINVDKSVVDPYINIENGRTYVLRCHYVPKDGEVTDVTLPELPYQLVQNRESTDLWCFGLLLFALCSGGRPLFPQNIRTGHLLSFESIVNWDSQASAANVYEHVKDPLALDVLLMLLSLYEDRTCLSMDTVLSHPFFNRTDGSVPEKLINRRLGEIAAYDRRRQIVASEKSEDDWLKGRTTSVASWNFDILKKMHFSCSGLVGKVVGKTTEALGMPCSFILLPYLLSAKNKKAKLAPTTKKDVERAEQMGTLLLVLAKACYFAAIARDVITKTDGEHWTASKLIESMSSLPSGGDFDDLKEHLIKIGAGNIEAFRTDPASILHMLVGHYVRDITVFFQKTGKALFYLVDEYTGTPLTNAACTPYPLEIPQKNIDSLLLMVLPSMHASILSVRGISGGVSGLVRLIFEAAYPHVPSTWAQAGAGLPHALDQDHFVKEVTILHQTLAFMSSSKASQMVDDLQIVREMCLKFDNRATFADMQRVEFLGSSLWTTKEGAAEIQEICRNHSFKEALDSQAALEDKIKTQEHQIKKLEEHVKRLSFRKALNLNVPDKEQNQNISNQVQVSHW